jgi:hypothetical protein
MQPAVALLFAPGGAAREDSNADASENSDADAGGTVERPSTAG